MLQPDPRNRPESMAEIAAWQLPIEQSRAPARQTDPADPRRSESGRRHRARQAPARFAAAAIALSAIIALALGAYLLLPSHRNLVAPRAAQAIGPAGTEGPTRTATAARLLKGYDGGPCFFVKPLQIAEEAAYVEGYGRERPPFDDLDAAFRRAVGFEAAIGVHQVEPAQCPALALLDAMRNAPAPPNIALEKTALTRADALSGTIEGAAGRDVELIMVTDDGSVRSLEIDTFVADGDKRAFRADLDPSIANGKLQLLVAIASAKPLASLAKDVPATAEKLFARVLDEARDPDLAVAANLRSFKLDK
jgi:serine/threonine-protein kinase